MIKNITRAGTIVLLSSIVIIVFTATAFSDSPPACSFAGTAKLDGADVTDGSVITATIEGVEYTTTTPTGYGASTYAITIQQNDSTHYADGDPVSFKINGYDAGQTATWQAGQNIRLDLNAWTTTSSSASSPNIWLIVGLAVACVAEIFLVGTVAYITVSRWNR
jgi:hypothetical protein